MLGKVKREESHLLSQGEKLVSRDGIERQVFLFSYLQGVSVS
jgi:hypothetical protein